TRIGAQTQRPLAIVVVGGMVMTLLLNRSLMPVLYGFYGNREPSCEAANMAWALRSCVADLGADVAEGVAGVAARQRDGADAHHDDQSRPNGGGTPGVTAGIRYRHRGLRQASDHPAAALTPSPGLPVRPVPPAGAAGTKGGTSPGAKFAPP